MDIAQKITSLDPRQFENFIYDLLLFRGLENVVWRTPGADGGRDIEAILPEIDFAGETSTQKWYIECKRYSNSVDWPTVRNKVAYAENHCADYLLIAATTTFSPQCLSEVTLWNNKRKRPQIRLWPIHTLENIICSYPALQLKYQLSDNKINLPGSFFPLSLHIIKTVQSAIGIDDNRNNNNEALEAAAALGILLNQRLADFHQDNHVNYIPFNPLNDNTGWLNISTECIFDNIDKHSFIALVSYVRFICKIVTIRIQPFNGDGILLLLDNTELQRINSAKHLLNEICYWGNFECDINNTMGLIIRKR